MIYKCLLYVWIIYVMIAIAGFWYLTYSELKKPIPLNLPELLRIMSTAAHVAFLFPKILYIFFKTL